MKHITTYIENNRTFEVFYAESGKGKGYWAVEDKYIDENGRLTKQLNGISGFHTQSAAETVKLVSDSIKVDAMCEQGIDRMAAAIVVVTGVPLETVLAAMAQ